MQSGKSVIKIMSNRIANLNNPYLVEKIHIHLNDSGCSDVLWERVKKTNLKELITIHRRLKESSLYHKHYPFYLLVINRVKTGFKNKNDVLDLDQDALLYAYVEFYKELDAALSNFTSSEIQRLMNQFSKMRSSAITDQKHVVQQSWMFGLFSTEYNVDHVMLYLE